MARILLTGFMGCGKSTVGGHLAFLMDLPFVDLDQFIEKRCYKAIPDIFEQDGEAAFRRSEKDALMALPDPLVCALGGGALQDPANLNWIRRSGLLIYLQVRPEVLQDRILGDPTDRPMLHGPDGSILQGSALNGRITSLLKNRETQYKRAHITVDCSDLTPLQTARACLKAINLFKERSAD